MSLKKRADVGERLPVALDVAEYIIQHASVESIYDGELDILIYNISLKTQQARSKS